MAGVKERANKLNARSLRKLQNEMDAQREMERMHLQTIRTEKMRLQKELERVRLKGQYMTGRNPAPTKSSKLLQARFSGQKNLSVSQSLNLSDRPPSRLITRSPSSPHLSSANQSSDQSTSDEEEEYPLEAEYRRRQKDFDEFYFRKQIAQEKQRTHLKKERKEISAKVEEFSNSFVPRSPRLMSTDDDNSIEEIVPLDKNVTTKSLSSGDGSHSSKSSRPARKKSRQMSIADYDVNQAKDSIAKRLLTSAGDSVRNSINDSSSSITQQSVSSSVRSKRESLRRRSTQAAIFDRDQVNKYAPVEFILDNPEEHHMDEEKVLNGKIQSLGEKGTHIQLSLAGVGATTKRKVLEIIENPELQFDEETYAPDGALRTLHMLPPAEDAFAEASKARYLRWRDPKNLERERELSINEIFAKDSSGNYRKDSQDL